MGCERVDQSNVVNLSGDWSAGVHTSSHFTHSFQYGFIPIYNINGNSFLPITDTEKVCYTMHQYLQLCHDVEASGLPNYLGLRTLVPSCFDISACRLVSQTKSCMRYFTYVVISRIINQLRKPNFNLCWGSYYMFLGVLKLRGFFWVGCFSSCVIVTVSLVLILPQTFKKI